PHSTKKSPRLGNEAGAYSAAMSDLPTGSEQEAHSGTFVSELFDPAEWLEVPGFELEDVTYHRARHLGKVRVAFNPPECRNAFRPRTVDELYQVLEHARTTSDVGCVLLTGNGPSKKDGGWAFSSGGDQRIRGKDGYKYEGEDGGADPARL